ncbi:MAG: GntR family transcriptional regulator [Armatimonadota bacterium]
MQLPQIEKPNRDSKTPLYVQIIDNFSEAIRTGVLKSGDRLPPQADLADFFGVSLAPVKQALSELEKHGIIARRQGQGTFVRDITPVREERIQYSRIPWFHREMKERGLKPTAEVLDLEKQKVGSDRQLQQELELDAEDDVVMLRRVRLANEMPVSLQTAWFIADKVSGLEDRNIGIEESITDILREEYGIVVASARQRITATTAVDEDGRYLNVPEGSPLLLVERTSYLENGTPLEFVRDRRHSTWQFTVWLRRQDEA